MHMKGGMIRWLTFALLALLVSCAPSPPPPLANRPGRTPVDPAAPVPPFQHIFVLVLENKPYEAVIGNQQAPYLNRLAQQYGRATNYYAIGHPSLPNYRALTGGDTCGIT